MLFRAEVANFLKPVQPDFERPAAAAGKNLFLSAQSGMP